MPTFTRLTLRLVRRRPCPRPACVAALWLAAGLIALPTGALAAEPSTRPMTVPTVVNPSRAASGAASGGASTQPGELAPATKTLRDAAADPTARRQAASALLQQGGPQATAVLLATLERSDVSGQQAVAQALASAADPPPIVLAGPLLDLLPTKNEALQSDAAAALARFDDPATFARVQAAARDEKAPAAQRIGAIASLGFHHDQSTAQVLVELLDAQEPTLVRDAAVKALGQMTGLAVLNYGPAQWQQWWERVKHLNRDAFQDELLKGQQKVRDELIERVRELQGRIAVDKRQIYRTAPKGEQEGLLVGMLGTEDIDAVRQAAVELAVQRVSDSGPMAIGGALRQALRRRLGDRLPPVRQRAALVLTAVDDNEAADQIELVLAKGEEYRPELLRQDLLMMARMPRAGAVKPALRFLSDPTLRGEAAVALAAAADAQLLDAAQTREARRLARAQVKDAATPEPRLVTLLSRVGAEEDWTRIEGWLDHPKFEVSEAAAKGWARADRPLLVLAQRISNPAVLPVLLDEAIRRGNDPKVFALIAENRPGQEALIDLWQKALAAMAGRVAPDAVLKANAQHKARNESTAFRAQLLTIAVDQLLPPPTGGAARDPVDLVELLLARAEIRADEKDFRQAQADYQRIDVLKLPLSPAQQTRHDLGALAAQLAVNDLTPNDLPKLFELGNRLVKADGGPSVNQQLPLIVFEMFLAYGEKLVPAGAAPPAAQKEKAQAVALFLHGLALPGLPEKPQERLLRLVENSGAVLPPVEPVNTTAPATQPLGSAATQPATRPASATQPASATAPASE